MPEKGRATHKRTICEVLREINDITQDNSKKDNTIRDKLNDIERMAKRMVERLRFYADLYHNGKSWNDGMWEEINGADKRRIKRSKKGYKVGK